MERATRLLRLDVCELHDLAPLLGFEGEELTELSRRAWKRIAPQLRNPRLDLWLDEGGVDFFVERLDYL